MSDNSKRNKRILALRGKKSFGLIAAELGISRAMVAGVCCRASIKAGHEPGPRGGAKIAARKRIPCGRPELVERNNNILALRGKYSISLIAEKLGIPKYTVWNVFFRADRRRGRKIGKPGGGHRYAEHTRFSDDARQSSP